jgi:hypothetical protein
MRCLLKLGNKRTGVGCRVIVKDTKTLFVGSGGRGVGSSWGRGVVRSFFLITYYLLPTTYYLLLQTSYLPEGLELGLDEVVVGGLAFV